MATGGFVYHLCHVFSDRLGSLHGVDGDGAGLLDAQLALETLLELVLREVQFGVVVVQPLQHTHITEGQRQTGTTE